MKPTHEQLIAGDVYTTSLVNEPVDFVVDFVVKPKGETATERARRRWGMEPDQHERR